MKKNHRWAGQLILSTAKGSEGGGGGNGGILEKSGGETCVEAFLFPAASLYLIRGGR